MEKVEKIINGQRYLRLFRGDETFVNWLAGLLKQILLGNEEDITESDRKILTQIIRRRALRNLRIRHMPLTDKTLNAYIYNILWRAALDYRKSQVQDSNFPHEEQDISFDELIRALRPVPMVLNKDVASTPTPYQHLTIKEGFVLTPQFLSTILAPYLEAVAAIQRVYDDVLQRPRGRVLIKSISHLSPIDISLSGAAETITALKEDLIPWRKKHAKELATLQAKHAQSEIKKLEAEALEVRARSTKERAESEKIRAEAAKVKEEAEQLRLENDARRFELQKAKFELALELVSKMQPDLLPADRYVHAMRLLPALNTLTTSDIDLNLAIS